MRLFPSATEKQVQGIMKSVNLKRTLSSQRSVCSETFQDSHLKKEVNATPWMIHVTVWQKPLQYCKVISLQPIKINGKK